MCIRDRFKGDVNANTVVFADSTFISEADVAGLDAKQVYLFPATKCAEDNFGTAVCANIVMMGFIVAKSSEITLENAQEALREVMSPKVLEPVSYTHLAGDRRSCGGPAAPGLGRRALGVPDQTRKKDQARDAAHIWKR